MKFTLTYIGPLKATTAENRRLKDKQVIRRVFHKQLCELWHQIPLSKIDPGFLTINPTDGKTPLMHVIGGFQFIPLVCEQLNLVAELNITLLRPEPPGMIITQSGDIDNRLKTLFDSLKMPSTNEIAQGDKPENNETPFYCLLEDDNLITKVSVDTDRLLEQNDDSSFARLLIHVTTRPTFVTFGNLVLM